MSQPNQSHELDALILDLAEWVCKAPRQYDEVMEAWRTSCPRLTVWEDAIERGFVERFRTPDGIWMVRVTAAGEDFLAANGRMMRVGL